MKRVRNLAMNEYGVVFDPGTGESFTINETANMIIRSLQSGRSVKGVVEEFSEIFDADPERIRSEVTDFVDILKLKGLYEGKRNFLDED